MSNTNITSVKHNSCLFVFLRQSNNQGTHKNKQITAGNNQQTDQTDKQRDNDNFHCHRHHDHQVQHHQS